MTDILFRFATLDAFFAAMTELGVPNFPGNREEEQLGVVATPTMITHLGLVRTVRLNAEQLAKIPDIILSPETVLIDWRSDEEPFEEANPSYTHDVDIDGVLTVVACKPGRIGQ